MRSYQHTAFSVHDRYDILYGGTKATLVSVQGVDVDFGIDMDFASPQRCETCPQPLIQWEPVALSLGAKRPGREAEHSPPSSADVKEGVDLFPYSPMRLHGVVLS
jgi:hypothetical protein